MPALDDKVAIVTGAGRGIGREHALHLARAGAKIVVNDLGASMAGEGEDAGPAEQVVNEIKAMGGDAIVNGANVADFEAAGELVKQAIEHFGQLDILINNAGILRDRMLFNMTEEDWDAVINVHLKGTFNCTRHAAVHMRQQKFGRIISMSSTSGLYGNSGQANYGAAKDGIAGMTRVVSRDLGKYGITVNAICPVAGTRMTVNEEVRRARQLRKQQGIQREDRGVAQIEELDPDDIAPMVVYLASEYARDVNGQFFLCFGGQVSLVSQPRPVKALYKADGNWTLDELERLAPGSVAEGLVNPAPPKEA
jgi:NAD(P)-dependent dehydrogenase (short-subunit alcohol dehydrogenase family)